MILNNLWYCGQILPMLNYCHCCYCFQDLVRLFDVDRRAPQNKPPEVNRDLKPKGQQRFDFKRNTPSAPADPTAPPNVPERQKTLYEELLELGDDFDIDNIDFGECYSDSLAISLLSERELENVTTLHIQVVFGLIMITSGACLS